MCSVARRRSRSAAAPGQPCTQILSEGRGKEPRGETFVSKEWLCSDTECHFQVDAAFVKRCSLDDLGHHSTH